ncbi:MAG: hypothetical protein LLG05_12625 [Porphyromonadaceae bacterium]|nr:hypothetical protein [Porphyromonadaceae bacterium]
MPSSTVSDTEEMANLGGQYSCRREINEGSSINRADLHVRLCDCAGGNWHINPRRKRWDTQGNN